MMAPGRGAALALLLILAGCSGEQADKEPPSPIHTQLTASLRANGCAACHSVDRTAVGPSMVAVAERYGSDSAARVASSIRAGSSKQWGNGRMPPQPRVSEAEAQQIAALVGQLAPAAQ